MAKLNVEKEELSALEEQFRSMLPDNDDEQPEVVPVAKQRGELDEADDGDEVPEQTESDEDTDVDVDTDESGEDDSAVEPTEDDLEDKTQDQAKKGIKKTNSKEQNLIVEQKRLIKRLAEENRELTLEKQRQKEAKQKEELIEKYKGQGYDEDTSNKYANDDLRLARLEERQAIADFRDDNDDILRRYPQAKADILTIMQKQQKNPDFSVEEICEKMYKVGPDSDRRAIDSVRNRSQQQSPNRASDSRVAAASRQAAPTSTILSRSDLAKKEVLDSLRDKPMSNKEYLERKNKFGL